MPNEMPNFVELNPNSKAKRYNQEERNTHCLEWEKSGLSMSQYCQQSKITVSSLSKWVNENKLLSEQKKDPFTSSSNDQDLEIMLDGGIRLRISRLSLLEITKLVKWLSSPCN